MTEQAHCLILRAGAFPAGGGFYAAESWAQTGGAGEGLGGLTRSISTAISLWNLGRKELYNRIEQGGRFVGGTS
jgi:hypothetical protein